MKENKKCSFLGSYNGDGLEETDGHDYDACKILIDEDIKKYKQWSTFDSACYIDNYEECEVYKKAIQNKEE